MRAGINYQQFAEFQTGKRLLFMFFGFAIIGYLLNGLIPSEWVAAVFGAGRAFSIPSAATLGLPLYVNSEDSLSLIRTMLDAGMSEGAALAFLITGAGTFFGAVAGALTIARFLFLLVFVALILAGSCSKEENPQTIPVHAPTMSISISRKNCPSMEAAR